MGHTAAVDARACARLATMRNSPWANSPGVQQFSSAADALPGGIRQSANIVAWSGFTVVDGLGLFDALPEMPGLRDVRVG